MLFTLITFGAVLNVFACISGLWAKVWMFWCWEMSQGSCYYILYRTGLNESRNPQIARAVGRGDNGLQILDLTKDPSIGKAYRVTLFMFREFLWIILAYNICVISLISTLGTDSVPSGASNVRGSTFIYVASALFFLMYFLAYVPEVISDLPDHRRFRRGFPLRARDRITGGTTND